MRNALSSCADFFFLNMFKGFRMPFLERQKVIERKEKKRLWVCIGSVKRPLDKQQSSG